MKRRPFVVRAAVAALVASGLVAGTAQAGDVAKILDAWHTYQDTKQALYGRSDAQSTAERHAVQAGVDAYINQIASQNNQLQGLYSTVFAPLLESN